MYYYIFDIKKCKKRSQVENIKNHLAALGISGEFTYPSSAQTIEELVNLGLNKEYTTIVAIGSDEIANRVASVMVGKKEAMGFIPLEESPTSTLIGVKGWKDACEALRYRKINPIRIGRTGSGACFLTELQLSISHPTEVTLEFKDFIIQTQVKGLKISNFNPLIKKIGVDFLDISMISVRPENGSIISKISSVFKTVQDDKLAYSLLRARSLRVFTKNQIPLITSETQIAKTPQLIESTDENLRLITAKNAPVFWAE